MYCVTRIKQSDVTARCSDAIYSRATPRPFACSRYFIFTGNEALISYIEVTASHDMLDAQLFPRLQRVPRRKPAHDAGHFYGLLYAGINTSASYVRGPGLQCRPTTFLMVLQQHETGHQRLSITQKPPSKLRISNVRHADGFRLIAIDRHVRDGVGAG